MAVKRDTKRPRRQGPNRALASRRGLGPGGERAISATEAARNFSNVLNRIELRGEAFVIERGGRPVARLGPASPTYLAGADFAALMRELPRPDDDYLDLIEHLARSQHPIEPAPWEG